MRIFVRGVFFAALLMCFGCSEQTDITPKIEKENQFSIKQAKEVFVRDCTAAVEAKEMTTRAHKHIHYTLADTDYTPLWDKAVSSENDHIVSIDVPIYSTAAAFVSNGNGENMRMATQKLVFIQNKESKETYSYLLTLCPDEECANKYADLNKVFIHAGDKSQFSGVAIYTDLEGKLVAIDRYQQGVSLKYVYVGNSEVSEETRRVNVESVMNGYRPYLSAAPITRGGYDTTYEELCAECFSNPCVCPNSDYYDNYCMWCGSWISFGSNTCSVCNAELSGCEKCGLPKSACVCNSDNNNFEETCPNCGNHSCICDQACPNCGQTTCEGCGEVSDKTNNEPEDEVCEYCNTQCNNSCSAFCIVCKKLKTECIANGCECCKDGECNGTCKC